MRPRWTNLIRALWIAGYLVGTTTHVIDLVLGGLDVYAGYPFALRLFWVSLTLLDPTVVLLIALRRRAGVVLGVAVIVVDVIINSVAIGPSPGLLNQVLFGVFLLATAVPLWRSVSRRTPPAPAPAPRRRPRGPGRR